MLPLATLIACGVSTSSGAGGADCAVLETQLFADLAGAKLCDIGIDSAQCILVVDGPCCPVALNPANQVAVSNYQTSFSTFKTFGCQVACPEVPCHEPTDGVCGGAENPGSCYEITGNSP